LQLLIGDTESQVKLPAKDLFSAASQKKMG